MTRTRVAKALQNTGELVAEPIISAVTKAFCGYVATAFDRDLPAEEIGFVRYTHSQSIFSCIAPAGDRLNVGYVDIRHCPFEQR